MKLKNNEVTKIKKIAVKKLPVSETFILTLKNIRNHLYDNFLIKLFMTNDQFELDTLNKTNRIEMDGLVVCDVSISKEPYDGDFNSYFLHLYKLKKEQCNDDLKKQFLEKEIPFLKNWIRKTISNRTFQLKSHKHLTITLFNNSFKRYDYSY